MPEALVAVNSHAADAPCAATGSSYFPAQKGCAVVGRFEHPARDFLHERT